MTYTYDQPAAVTMAAGMSINQRRTLGRIARALLLAWLCAASAHAQTAGNLAPVAKQQFFANNGDVCAGCKVYTYTAGTSTPASTYSDAALTIANANPTVLDSAGRGTFYLSTATYKFVLADSAGVTIWTQDNVPAVGLIATAQIGTSLTLSGVERVSSVITPPQITANQNDYSPTGLSTARFVRLSTDASRNITGLAAQTSGTLVTLINAGAQDIVLVVSSVSSSAANRIQTPGNVNLTLQLGDAATLWYDGSFSVWRVIGY